MFLFSLWLIYLQAFCDRRVVSVLLVVGRSHDRTNVVILSPG